MRRPRAPLCLRALQGRGSTVSAWSLVARRIQGRRARAGMAFALVGGELLLRERPTWIFIGFIKTLYHKGLVL